MPAWVINLEDRIDERERRLAAVLIPHGISNAAVQDRLFLHSRRQRRLCMARQFADCADGATITHAEETVIEQAVERGIWLIVIDPFVKSHGARRELQRAQGRGGDGLVGDCRGDRRGDPAGAAALAACVRQDDVKANMAPREEGAPLVPALDDKPGQRLRRLFARQQRGGDRAMTADTVWSQMPAAECNRLLDPIDAGPDRPGRALYAPSRRGRSLERWAGGDGRARPERGADRHGDQHLLRQGVPEQAGYRDEAQRQAAARRARSRREAADDKGFVLRKGNI